MVVSAIDLIWPHKFSTILEVYYDTPYDRHVILEESHDVRYRKRNSRGLEDPPSLGSRILRYFFVEIYSFLSINAHIK
jgi:dual oxidase maturation factor 1